MSLYHFLSRAMQWRLAPEFRIESEPAGGLTDAIESLLAMARSLADTTPSDSLDASELQQETPAEPTKVDEGETNDCAEFAPQGHNLDFVIRLCNGYFRLSSNADELEAAGESSRQLRNIRRSLSQIQELFEEHKIECSDLTGQTFHHGRHDVDIIGEAEERAHVTCMMIERCNRPAVFLNGDLIQRARVIVVKPLVVEENSPDIV